jgi:Beta-lactamase enzyme family
MQIKNYLYSCFLAATSSFLSCTAYKPALVTIPVQQVNAVDDPLNIPAAPVSDSTLDDEFLDSLLKQYPQYFDSILAHRKAYNVQVIYTQIDRGANGMAALKNHYLNVNAGNYFYPASTVKFPVSLLALQRLNELKDKGIDKNTTMLTLQGFSGQTAVLNDPTTVDGQPSIAQYIKKILMVSDNDAYNRLYEFLGSKYINEQLHQKGYGDVQLLHRLQMPLSADENRHTNDVEFLGINNKVLYQQPMQYDTTQYALRNDSIGTGYISGGQLLNSAMDFSAKNRIGLQDLHDILISLIFPYRMKASQRMNITEEDRNFVLKYMSQLPTESTFPAYSADTINYYPAYCKFLLYGAEKGPLPKNIRVFNKVGDAYGQLLDIAYIVDFDKKIEFFLSVVIYCNSDGILNDDKYDYDSIGFPFMKHLGQVIYDYETKRERKIEPDLSGLKFVYDKE